MEQQQEQELEKQTVDLLDQWCRISDEEMAAKGFNSVTPTAIALMHQELSELLDWYRKGQHCASSAKVPGIDNAAEECADLFLRLTHFCGARGIKLGAAVIAKRRYNLTRPHKHGREF